MTFIFLLRELCSVVTADALLQLRKEKLLVSHHVNYKLSAQMGVGEFHGTVNTPSESSELACAVPLNLKGEPPPVQL